jgi:hypothetical protein
LRLKHRYHATTQGVRCTFSPAAQAEVLDRLLELNHARYAAEVAAGMHEERRAKAKERGKRGAEGSGQMGLFGEDA